MDEAADFDELKDAYDMLTKAKILIENAKKENIKIEKTLLEPIEKEENKRYIFIILTALFLEKNEEVQTCEIYSFDIKNPLKKAKVYDREQMEKDRAYIEDVDGEVDEEGKDDEAFDDEDED